VIQSFTIDIGEDSFSSTSFQTIAGEIAVRVGSHSFPEAGWSDLPVALLSGWTHVVAALLSGTESERPARCHFMDGPFWVELEPVDEGSWRVRLIDNHCPQRCELDEVVAVADVVSSLIDSGKLVLRVCEEKGWRNRDTEELRRSLRELRVRWSSG